MLGASAYYRVFCNTPLHSEAWTSERIGKAIDRGLGYLHATGSFRKHVTEGGEMTPHHYFLQQVLLRHPHEGLAAQLETAKEVNRDQWEWRTFFGMPGWPRDELTDEDRRQIIEAVKNSPIAPYSAWMAYALYPDWTELSPEDKQRLLIDTCRLKTTYDLTHALLAYLWMREVAPEAAKRHRVDQLIEQVNRRLKRIQHWDPCTGDLYNERVAFWLYMKDGPPVKRRWIERILLAQNIDGGWTYRKSIPRTIGQFFGIDSGDYPSHPHPTFLALLALSEFAHRMSTPPDHEAKPG